MTVCLLDYPFVDIKMHVDSQVEQDKRITACHKEGETVEWLHSLPSNSVVFDVGACTGAYSLVAAHLGHRVVAFEPSAPNYAQLVRNLALNPDLHVLALPCLLSWKTGLSAFTYSSLDTGAALHNSGEGIYTQTQVAWSLDELVAHPEMALPVPTALKIDTDGHELSVIKGATTTLEGVQSLLVELDTTCKDSELVEPVLTMWGFSVKSRHPHGESPVSNVIFHRGP